MAIAEAARVKKLQEELSHAKAEVCYTVPSAMLWGWVCLVLCIGPNLFLQCFHC